MEGASFGDHPASVRRVPTQIGGRRMSRSVNKITLIGNVGRDPDIQQTKNGTKVAHFSLATNRRAPNGSEEEERTDWHRLTLWNRQAQFAEDYIRTGDRVYIEGRLEYDSYERDGVVIPTAEITVREVVLLSPKAALGEQEMDDAA
jgi:single-strand DNA-binding protein